MLGIIPCGGKGMRWGGYYKEMLPLDENKWIIDGCIDQMTEVGVNKICIISSMEKIQLLSQHFTRKKYQDKNIVFVIQKYDLDMWGAILTALPLCVGNEWMYFGMPDTIFGRAGYPIKPPNCDFSLSLFNTIDGRRFGVYDRNENKVINKNENLIGGNYEAWGNFSFSEKLAKAWIDGNFTNYTDAINFALKNYNTHFHSLDYYYDFTSFEEYKCFLTFA